MATMTPVELRRAVEENRIPNLVLLHGEERFLLGRALSLIRDRVLSPEETDFNLTQFEARQSRGFEVVDAARTLPIFAERRLVVVKELQDFPAAELEALLPYLAQPVAETVLLCTSDKVDGRRKFFQEFKKRGTLVEFKRLFDNQLPGFVTAEARRQGRSFTEDALAQFCRRVGTNLQEVTAELEKLFTYLGERDLVDVADVRAVVSDARVDSIFDLTNAIGRRDASEAIRLLHRLLNEGTAPLLVLSMLVRHFRQLWRAHALQQQGVERKEMPRRIGINPYFLNDLLAQVRRFSEPEYRRAFELFLGLDLALKSSGSHPAPLLEKLILELLPCRRAD